MKQKAKKVACILLVMCLMSVNIIATAALTATEEEYAVQPRFTYIWSISVGLGIEPDGYSTCDTGMTLYEETHSARIDMTLQRNDGSGWDDVKSWSVTDDGPDVDITEHRYVVSGYDYRVVAEVRVYNSNGRIIEMTTEYSPIVEY